MFNLVIIPSENEDGQPEVTLAIGGVSPALGRIVFTDEFLAVLENLNNSQFGSPVAGFGGVEYTADEVALATMLTVARRRGDAREATTGGTEDVNKTDSPDVVNRLG